MQVEALLEAADLRLRGPLKAADLDGDKNLIEAGFRGDDDKVYIARITWKKVKYAGKESYSFELNVYSLDPNTTEKRPVARVSDGKVRKLSLPALGLEATRSFKQEISG